MAYGSINNFEPFYQFKCEHHLKNLSSGFKSLYETSDLVDITMSVDGGTVKAHRVMLAASSSYFRNIFKTISYSEYPVVFLKDVPLKDLGHVIEFIYNGEVTVDTPSIKSFLKTARLLKIVGLFQDELDEGGGPEAKDLVKESTNTELDEFQKIFQERNNLTNKYFRKRPLMTKEMIYCDESSNSKKVCLSNEPKVPLCFPNPIHFVEADTETRESTFEGVMPVSPEPIGRKPSKRPCPHCDQLLSIHAIVRHIKDTHSSNDKIKCPHCPKLFKNKNSLGCHTWRFHKEASFTGIPPISSDRDQIQLKINDE